MCACMHACMHVTPVASADTNTPKAAAMQHKAALYMYGGVFYLWQEEEPAEEQLLI